jgi:hypothetical protein
VSEPKADTKKTAKMTFRAFERERERERNKTKMRKKKLYQAQKKYIVPLATPTPNISLVQIK